MASQPPLVVLLDYRSAMETVDLDTANFNSWKEALDSFGYQNLDEPTFLQDLALSTSAEVMMALCPYTTKEEWGPALNKRDLRLAREVDDMCYANVVPVPGVTDLVTNASKHRRTTVVLLSPFREDITRQLLQTSGLATLVDVVVCYTALDVAVLEALAHLKCPPPTIPEKFVSAMPEAFASPDPNFANADIVAFVSTAMGARKMRGYGISQVGVLHNSCDQENDVNSESDDDPEVLPGRDDAASLKEAGCELVVSTFKSITPEHLNLLRSSKLARGSS